MSKVPCGGFELGDSLVINDGKLDLAPGAGGVQSDWDVNDESNLAFIKNRICYDDGYKKVEGSIRKAGYRSDFGSNLFIISNELWNILLTKHANILRKDDNTTYLYYDENDLEIRYEYNKNQQVETLHVSKSESKAYFLNGSLTDGQVGSAADVAVQIGSIKQIDPKYIPSIIAYVNVTTSDGGTYTADKTLDEINELIKQGIDVKALLTLPNDGCYHFTIIGSSPEACLFSMIAPSFDESTKALLFSITINASEVKVNTIEF